MEQLDRDDPGEAVGRLLLGKVDVAEATFGDLEFAAMVRKMDKEKKDPSWRN